MPTLFFPTMFYSILWLRLMQHIGYTQILKTDRLVFTNYLGGQFVYKILTDIVNMLIQLCQFLLRFVSPFRAFHAPTDNLMEQL